ncbi:MAG: WYL domain-containing protein, partial [Bacillota bacterium]|nr:WYL domain-containing protein [Bacillota bacterium]
MFSDFIKHYNIIRSILRDVFLYGCFSREGLEGKRKLSSRKVSYEIRRIQQYVEAEFIRTDMDGRNKLLALTYDSIRNTENFLVKTYMTKSFTKSDLILYFSLLMFLNTKDKSCCFREIEEGLIAQGAISYDNISSKTVERKLDEMCSNLGILQCETIKRAKYYTIADDIFKELDNKEIEELITAAALFKNITFPVTAGYYCEQSLKDYAEYERNISIETKDYFQYNNLHFHPVIEEHILWEIIKAIHKRKYIKLKYNLSRAVCNETSQQMLRPYKVRYDISCGRFYLVSFAEDSRCVVSRLDRIEDIEVCKETYNADKLEELYEKNFNYSWSSVNLSMGKKIEKIKLEIIIEEPK